MKQGWTIFNSVMLVISMIACFILVIVAAVMQSSFLVFIIGFVAVVLIHSMWAMLVEMSKNIIRLSKPCSNSEIEKASELKIWNCNACGNTNSGDCAFCQNCGKPRNSQTVDNTDNSTNSEVW